MKIPFSPPDITELEIQEVIEAMHSGWITTGPRTKKLEGLIADYLGTPKVVCLNSATASLEMTLRVLGIGPGDEVITSAYSYTASASPVVHVGAKLVLVDTRVGSYEMDYDQVAAAITNKTKAIIPVDIAGVPCDYDRIFDIINTHSQDFKPANDIQAAIGRIMVIADCAHSFGASKNGVMTGNIADFSSFSFHAVKNFTTAEGGCATWRDIPGVDHEAIYKQYQLLSLHGQDKDALAKTKMGAWEYDIKGCYYKCNMTDIMAAIGLAQLKRYPNLLARRHEIIDYYDKRLIDSPVEILEHYNDRHQGSGHLYMIRLMGKSLENRNAFISKMAERGIATNVHYKPIPMHTAYKNLGFDIADYPNAYQQFSTEVTLPLHTKLTDEEVDFVITNTKEVLGEL